jgi:hypothetical protein
MLFISCYFGLVLIKNNLVMKLHEIIEINGEDKKSVLIETMAKYKNSLRVYFEDYFCTKDLILMVTSVTNATSYGKIVPASEFSDAVDAWMSPNIVNLEDIESDEFAEYETICANSMPFDNLFK